MGYFLDVPEEPKKSTGYFLDLPEPGWGEVLSGVPTRTGLSFIEAAGGGARALGDLLRSDTISSWGEEVAQTARGARMDETPVGMGLGQQVVSGGLESALQMAPAMAVGPASMLATGIGTAAAQTGFSRYAELRDAGFSGGRAGLSSSIDALLEGVGEFVALPALSKSAKPFMARAWEFLARDLVGEEFTTVGQQLNAMMHDRPDMTLGEFLEGVKMTALVTPIASGAQIGMHAAASGIRGMGTSGDPTHVPNVLPQEPPPAGAAPAPVPPGEPPAPLALPAPTGPIADPYAEYTGKAITIPIELDDGTVATMIHPADVAMKEIDGRIYGVQLLAECLK